MKSPFLCDDCAFSEGKALAFVLAKPCRPSLPIDVTIGSSRAESFIPMPTYPSGCRQPWNSCDGAPRRRQRVLIRPLAASLGGWLMSEGSAGSHYLGETRASRAG